MSHITLKNLPESERPYERFQQLGAEALSDAELLAIILKTGTKELTSLDLARNLLSNCQGNLLNLYELSYEQLLMQKGIGPVKAIQLKAIAELSKRIAKTSRGYQLSLITLYPLQITIWKNYATGEKKYLWGHFLMQNVIFLAMH